MHFLHPCPSPRRRGAALCRARSGLPPASGPAQLRTGPRRELAAWIAGPAWGLEVQRPARLAWEVEFGGLVTFGLPPRTEIQLLAPSSQPVRCCQSQPTLHALVPL